MNMAEEIINMISSDTGISIAQQIEMLQCRTQKTGDDLYKIKLEEDALVVSNQQCTTLEFLITCREKELQEQFICYKLIELMQLWLTLASNLKDTVARLNTLQSKIFDEFSKLNRLEQNQRLAENVAIQEWYGSLAKLILQNKKQITEALHLNEKLALNRSGVQDNLLVLQSQIIQLLGSHVTSVFIIEEQPPQVIKVNTKFVSKVRLLVGGELNAHRPPPQVNVSIVNEFQANELLRTNNMAKIGKAIGEILNNTGTMEYHEETHQFSLTFNNMQLQKIQRLEKNGRGSVTDEKCALLFQSQFSIGDGELVFNVWTLSLPVVVIVHGNQEPDAWATITWDNAFAKPGRVPFAVSDKVPWIQVAEALNTKFQSATGRPLTENNLKFLEEKALRSGSSNSQDYSGLLLSWEQFCKKRLPEVDFTFWQWFYAIMKLTEEHLRDLWKNDYILGFVRKKEAKEMLARCPSGTFLMRFSDSQLGGVSIASVDNKATFFMLQPFTSTDLTIRSLADCVSDLQDLKYLYPALSKDQAFSKYYTQISMPISDRRKSKPKGYIPVQIVMTIITTTNSLDQPEAVGSTDKNLGDIDPKDLLPLPKNFNLDQIITSDNFSAEDMNLLILELQLICQDCD